MLKRDYTLQPVIERQPPAELIRQRRKTAARQNRLRLGTEVHSKKEKKYRASILGDASVKTKVTGKFSKQNKEKSLLQHVARYKRDGTVPGTKEEPYVVLQSQIDKLMLDGIDVRGLTQMIKIGLQRGCIEVNPGMDDRHFNCYCPCCYASYIPCPALPFPPVAPQGSFTFSSELAAAVIETELLRGGVEPNPGPQKLGRPFCLSCRKTGKPVTVTLQKQPVPCPSCGTRIFYMKQRMVHDVVGAPDDCITRDHKGKEKEPESGASTMAAAAEVPKHYEHVDDMVNDILMKDPAYASKPEFDPKKHTVEELCSGKVRPPVRGPQSAQIKEPVKPRLFDGERAPRAVLDEVIRDECYGDPATITIREAIYRGAPGDGLLCDEVVKRAEGDFRVVVVDYEAFSDLIVNHHLGRLFVWIYSIATFSNFDLLFGLFHAWRFALAVFLVFSTSYFLGMWWKAVLLLGVFPSAARTLARPLVAFLRCPILWRKYKYVYIPHFYSTCRANANPRMTRAVAADLMHRILRQQANFPLPATKVDWRNQSDVLACYSFEQGTLFQRTADVSGLIYVDSLEPSCRKTTSDSAHSSAGQRYMRMDIDTANALYQQFQHQMKNACLSAQKAFHEAATSAGCLSDQCRASRRSARTATTKKPSSKGSGSASSDQQQPLILTDSESSLSSSEDTSDDTIEPPRGRRSKSGSSTRHTTKRERRSSPAFTNPFVEDDQPGTNQPGLSRSRSWSPTGSGSMSDG